MKQELSSCRKCFSMAVALILAESSASAAVNTWQGGVSSDFNTPANWSLGALAISDTSTFTGTALVQPNVSADITVAKVNFALGSTNYVLSSALGASPDLVPTFDVADLGFTPTGPLSLTDTGSEIVLNGVRVPPSGMSVMVVR